MRTILITVCRPRCWDILRYRKPASEPHPDGGIRFSRDTLVALPDKLREAQETFEETGGLHAAAAFDSHGEILVTREDVGRHNAVDKVVGVLLAKDLLPANDLGLIVSGRTSFELMQKTLMAGMPLLAAVSAPSSLAVQIAPASHRSSWQNEFAERAEKQGRITETN